MSSVDIVLPAKNESATIGKVVKELREEVLNNISAEHDVRIIVVDNGSQDATVNQAKDAGVDDVLLCAIPGKGAAMQVAIEKSSSDYILFHDADGEYSQRDAVTALKEFLESHKNTYDGFVCERLISISTISIQSFAANAIVRLLLKRIDRNCPKDILSGTRLYKREDLKKFKLTSHGFSIETELTKKSCIYSLKMHNPKIRYFPRGVDEGKKIRPWDIVPIVRAALR